MGDDWRWLRLRKMRFDRPLTLSARIRNLCLETCLFLWTCISFSPVLYICHMLLIGKCCCCCDLKDRLKWLTLSQSEVCALSCPGSMWKDHLGGCHKAVLPEQKQNPPKPVSLSLSWAGTASEYLYPSSIAILSKQIKNENGPIKHALWSLAAS